MTRLSGLYWLGLDLFMNFLKAALDFVAVVEPLEIADLKFRLEIHFFYDKIK